MIVAILAIITAEISASQIPRKSSVKKPECPFFGTARLPHSKECTLYYICQDGQAMLHECPDGLHFNNAIKQCDWPPAGCFPGMTRPETQPNIPEEGKANMSGCIGTCPNPDPMEQTIHLPYGGNCKKFCKCSNGTPFIMDCPPGLHFDKTLSVCNWPWVAHCTW